MKYLVFGSLNIDRTYTVPHFVEAGETLSARKMELFCGGKGFNQAVALSRAGKHVFFAGAVGTDGQMLLDALASDGIDAQFVKKTEGTSGHAVIQLDGNGQNGILILAGANGEIETQDIDRVLEAFEAGDLLVLQNEISNVDYLLRAAKAKALAVAFNPSPYEARIAEFDMDAVKYLLINETEGMQITGRSSAGEILDCLHEKYPRMNIVLTLGSKGVLYCNSGNERFCCGIYPSTPVDTTAAGDTFTGFFLAEITSSGDERRALQRASMASGLAVSRKGASPSIPQGWEVDQIPADRLLPFRGEEA